MSADRQPIFNVPDAVVWAIGLLVAVHAIRNVVDPAIDERIVLTLALIPARYTELLGVLPGGIGAAFASPLTYMLLHGDWIHLAINSAWLLAFGGAIARRIGGRNFILFAVATSIAGAALYLALNWGSIVPMIGASAAVSGLLAGVLRFLFSGLRMGGLEAFSRYPQAIPRTPLAAMFRDPQILLAIVAWAAINLLTGLAGNPFDPSAGIAWEAHLGGFIAGLLTFAWFDTGAGPRTGPRLVLH